LCARLEGGSEEKGGGVGGGEGEVVRGKGERERNQVVGGGRLGGMGGGGLAYRGEEDGGKRSGFKNVGWCGSILNCVSKKKKKLWRGGASVLCLLGGGREVSCVRVPSGGAGFDMRYTQSHRKGPAQWSLDKKKKMVEAICCRHVS